MIFFGDFGQKTRTAGLIMLKLSTKVNQVFWGKNLENENFMAAAIHCENWYFKKTNIFHYFPSKNLKYSQIFLSETIHAQENGSRGPHFAKSLNSNFLKGLTYCALSGDKRSQWICLCKLITFQISLLRGKRLILFNYSPNVSLQQLQCIYNVSQKIGKLTT